jgi:sRNA-binding protein
MHDLAINTPPSPQSAANAAQRRAVAIDQVIATLAQLFPDTFVAEDWQPHKPLKPLKLRIHLDLIARGVLMPAECRRVLARYCHRRAYQVALAGGGARIDLDGKASGDVTPAEQEVARGAIARMDALAIEKAAAGKVAPAAERAGSMAQAKLSANPESTTTQAGPKQTSGLADLKRAALARKQAGSGAAA